MPFTDLPPLLSLRGPFFGSKIITQLALSDRPLSTKTISRPMTELAFWPFVVYFSEYFDAKLCPLVDLWDSRLRRCLRMSDVAGGCFWAVRSYCLLRCF